MRKGKRNTIIIYSIIGATIIGFYVWFRIYFQSQSDKIDSLTGKVTVAALRARYSTKDAIATETKLYKMYTIERGDSLWSIAEEYVDYGHYDDIRDYVDEVISINDLNDKNSITAGCNLVIPYYREDTDESSN